MSLILSILAGLLGSLFGSAARAGAAMGRAQLEGEPMPDVMNLSGSPIAGVVGGVVGLTVDGFETWRIGRYADRELLPRARR